MQDASPDAGVCWNLAALYPDIRSTALIDDLRAAYRGMLAAGSLAERCAMLPGRAPTEGSTLAACAEFSTHCLKTRDLLSDLHVYCTARTSIGQHTDTTRDTLRRISAISAQLGLHEQRFAEMLCSWADEACRTLCDRAPSPDVAAHWNLLRQQGSQGVNDKAVQLLAPEASRAWSTLYERLARDLKVSMAGPQGEPLSLTMTQAIAAMTAPDGEQRRRAWHAIRAAWSPHEVTVAAILNSLAAHRIKVRRLGPPARDAGDVRLLSLSENRLQASTLDALIGAVDRRREDLRGALRLMAGLIGKERLDPWDLAAPYFDEGAAFTPLTIQQGLDAVQSAFAEISPELGGFVEQMRRHGWIDARPSDASRRLGAYQTSVRRGRHPLVFTNYQGRWSDLVTLAHELGHAFHFWVLRDLPAHTHHLPISLAECASAFAESQLRRCSERIFPAPQLASRFRAWDDAQAAVAFLLNIGASYTFELELHSTRHQREMSASELSDGLRRSWEHWFGTDISCADDRGWVRKPHFAGQRSFNNYPYMVGYLVAMLLDDACVHKGPSFFAMYKAFLLDSASFSLEELLHKYFGGDASTGSFWDSVLDLVVARLEAAADCAAPGPGARAVSCTAAT